MSFGAMSELENDRVQVVIPVYNSASSLAPRKDLDCIVELFPAASFCFPHHKQLDSLDC